MEGLAAKMMSSSGCKPDVKLSKLENPVLKPVIPPFLSRLSSVFSLTSRMTSESSVNAVVFVFCGSAKIDS